MDTIVNIVDVSIDHSYKQCSNDLYWTQFDWKFVYLIRQRTNWASRERKRERESETKKLVLFRTKLNSEKIIN